MLNKAKTAHSRFKVARRLLIFWTLFIGIGALCGACGMILDPSGKTMGMDAMLPYFKKLPFADILFRNFLFSGYALLVVNGITNIVSAVLILMHKKAGIVLGGIFGITLMLWICIQFYMFPFNFMSTAYFIFGAAQAATGFAAVTFQKQESFCVNLSDYPNIGANPERLVVFFSRMGYVKQKAFEEANRTGASVLEIKAAELTEGTAGFWWCGRFAMHRRDMPIKPIDIDLSAFSHITVCSPIWAFSLSAPMRTFCRSAKGKIAEADYILVHHTGGKYSFVADEMDKLLGIKRTGLKNFRYHAGSFKEIV